MNTEQIDKLISSFMNAALDEFTKEVGNYQNLKTELLQILNKKKAREGSEQKYHDALLRNLIFFICKEYNKKQLVFDWLNGNYIPNSNIVFGEIDRLQNDCSVTEKNGEMFVKDSVQMNPSIKEIINYYGKISPLSKKLLVLEQHYMFYSVKDALGNSLIFLFAYNANSFKQFFKADHKLVIDKFDSILQIYSDRVLGYN